MNNDEMLVLIKDMFEKSMSNMERKFEQKLEEAKRHTGMLFESLQNDIKTLAEGHSILDRRMDGLQNDIKSVAEGHSILDRKMDGLQNDIKAVADGHSVLDRKIDGLQKDIAETKWEVKEEINDLKKDINDLKKDMTVVKDYIIDVDAKLNEHELVLKGVK